MKTVTQNMPVQNRSREHIPELDGLRGTAVLAVLWGHAGTNIFGISIPGGHFGVDLFFLLSGFLITRIRLAEAQKNIGLKEFWIKRITRIFPAAYLCLAAVWVGWGYSSTLLWAGSYTCTFNPTMFKNPDIPPIGHFWTLALEEQFYLIWPLILLLNIRTSTLIVKSLCITSVILLTLVGTLQYFDVFSLRYIEMLSHQLITRGWPLMAGSIIAIYEPQIKARPSYLLLLTTLSLIIGIAIRLALSLFGLNVGTGIIPFKILGGQLLVLSFFSIVLFLAYKKFPNPFQLSILGWIGTISYGLYLYHLPIYTALGLHDNNSMFFIAITLTTLAAIASYYLFEVHFINLGRKAAKSIARNRLEQSTPEAINDNIAIAKE